ncbi:MAG: UvrD-helicase domain-containing protein [Verrucomicrobia bacterium]|nr:UvrD-helicase domain-containing protein [Verrucomicrobiota bacterium]
MSDLSSLNPQQRQAVQSILGPLLILAGAGTGKTRVITHRIVHMIQRSVDPRQILAVTFTNKAAREMQERVRKLFPRRRVPAGENPAAHPTICTFHSFCVRVLRQHIERLGYKRNFVIYDESEQLATVRKILSRISAKGEKIDPKLILSQLSRQRLREGPENAVEDPSSSAMAAHIRRQYESALHASNAVDFDDLLLLTLRLFNEHPESLKSCEQQFRYVMVDEYQDTSAAQFRLIHMLTRNHQNLCVVGDDDQSIYGWRGAEIKNLLNLERYFPGLRIIKLEQNYRSTNTILSAANAVIRHNAQRRPKQLWSENGHGEKISIQAFANEEEEARTVVEQIDYARKIDRIPWSAQAILFRTNGQSRPLETALRQAGVRYHLIGGQSFFDRREIKDFIAYLKVLINPHDDISLLRIANVPARGLSTATMERLLAASQEREASVYAAMRHTDVQDRFLKRTRDSICEFLSWIEQTRAPLTQTDPMPLPQWASAFLTEIEYWTELRRSEKNPETAESRVQNLKDLIAVMGERQTPGLKPIECLETFLEELLLDPDRGEDQPEGEAVTLITIHSCKGLEFPNVHIVGIEDGLLPHSRSKTEGTIDEERRLFYVAMTRAMKSLSISYCLGRKRYGEIIPGHPSPFLKELPSELLEYAEEKGKQPIDVESGKNRFASLRAALNEG